MDDPHVAAVERLIELARERGFTVTTAEERGSRWAERVTPEWRDIVFLGGVWALRRGPLPQGPLSPGEPLFTDRVSGSALTVLHTVVYGWSSI